MSVPCRWAAMRLLIFLLLAWVIMLGLFVMRRWYSGKWPDGSVTSGLEYTENVPILLWWTSFTSESFVRHCGKSGEYTCFITSNRTFSQSHRHLAAALFYGSNFVPWDLPLPRRIASQPDAAATVDAQFLWQRRPDEPLLWALFHEESPKNAPIFCHRPAISLFNVTATFRQHSDVPLTLQYLVSSAWLTGAAAAAVTPLGLPQPLAPVVYIASSCDNPSRRDQFVRQLSRHIPVDRYGACLNNRPLPDWARGGGPGDWRQLAPLVGQYRFSLALENAACPDYISEKLWLPLSVGTVPVYWGAPNVRRWLPCLHSAVLVTAHSSPALLAAHLYRLLDDPVAYRRHLCHRPRPHPRHWQPPIVNSRLRRALRRRRWSVPRSDGHLPSGEASHVDAFECAVCKTVWQSGGGRGREEASGSRRGRADGRHYGCGRPATVLGDDSATWWTEQWRLAAEEAHQLARVVQAGRPVGRDEFRARVARRRGIRDEL